MEFIAIIAFDHLYKSFCNRWQVIYRTLCKGYLRDKTPREPLPCHSTGQSWAWGGKQRRWELSLSTLTQKPEVRNCPSLLKRSSPLVSKREMWTQWNLDFPRTINQFFCWGSGWHSVWPGRPSFCSESEFRMMPKKKVKRKGIQNHNFTNFQRQRDSCLVMKHHLYFCRLVGETSPQRHRKLEARANSPVSFNVIQHLIYYKETTTPSRWNCVKQVQIWNLNRDEQFFS